ncbi:MAG: VWA domain-containing protein [Acidobacteriota bacterium]
MSLDFAEYQNYLFRRRFEKTISALLSSVNIIRRHTGRKTILFISQGTPEISKYEILKIFDPFNIISKRKTRFDWQIVDEIIKYANAENIAFYVLNPDVEFRKLLKDIDASVKFQSETLSMKEIKFSNYSLIHLAEETGGVLLRGGKKYEETVQELKRDLSYYYEIGYKPQREKEDGKYHRIEIKVKRPGVNVRSRKGYMDYSEEEKMKRNLASAFFSPEYFKEIEFRCEVNSIPEDKKNSLFWIRIEIPTEQFKRKESPPEDITLLFGIKELEEEKAHLGEVKIKIKEALKRNLSSLYYSFGTSDVKIKPGSYETAVILTSKEGKIGGYETLIKIPRLKKEPSPTILNSIFGFLKEKEGEGNLFTISREDGSLLLSKYRFFPSLGNEIKEGENIALFLQIYNPDDIEDSFLKFSLYKDENFISNLKFQRIESFFNKKMNILNEVYIFDLQDILPGDYQLKINFPEKIEKKIIGIKVFQ